MNQIGIKPMGQVENPQEIHAILDSIMESEDIAESDLERTIHKYIHALTKEGCRFRAAGWTILSPDSGYDIRFSVKCIGDEQSLVKADLAGIDVLIDGQEIPSKILDHVLFFMD